MGNWLLPLCVVVFFVALGFRIAMLPRDQRKRSIVSRLKYAKFLIAGLLALMAVGYRLEKTSRDLDGKKDHEPGLIERMVMAVSK